MSAEDPESKTSTMQLLTPSLRNVTRATWAWALTSLLLLLVIVIGATLIGVHLTQKHTEAVVQMAFMAENGEKVQQTVMVNDQDNMAACYINNNNVSTSILYDYRRGIIGFRRLGDNKCLVMRMKNVKFPTMADILNSIKDTKDEYAGSTEFIYNFQETKERADLTKLGVPINLLCSGQPVYWSLQDLQPQKKGFFDSIKKGINSVKNGIKHVVKNTKVTFKVGFEYNG